MAAPADMMSPCAARALDPCRPAAATRGHAQRLCCSAHLDTQVGAELLQREATPSFGRHLAVTPF
jgi:hypothetical protein